MGSQVSVALERARLYQQALAHEARMVHELEMARDVQATLIPRHMPDLPGFSLVADWRAARQVAGDFYDVFRTWAGGGASPSPMSPTRAAGCALHGDGAKPVAVEERPGGGPGKRAGRSQP